MPIIGTLFVNVFVLYGGVPACVHLPNEANGRADDKGTLVTTLHLHLHCPAPFVSMFLPSTRLHPYCLACFGHPPVVFAESTVVVRVFLCCIRAFLFSRACVRTCAQQARFLEEFLKQFFFEANSKDALLNFLDPAKPFTMEIS